jgi:hypothetical protein
MPGLRSSTPWFPSFFNTDDQRAIHFSGGNSHQPNAQGSRQATCSFTLYTSPGCPSNLQSGSQVFLPATIPESNAD